MKLSKMFCAMAFAGVALLNTGTTFAQAYPAGPIKIIVPFTPGSATDILGRVTGADLRCTMEGKELFTVPVGELHSAYESLPQRLA